MAVGEDTGGLTLVPAFSGLFAPYWRDDARAVAVGMQMTPDMLYARFFVYTGITSNSICMYLYA